MDAQFIIFGAKNSWSCSKGLKCRNRKQMANKYKHSLSSTIQPVSPNGTPSVGRWHMAYVIIGLCWVMGRFTLYPTQRFTQNNQNGEVYVHHHHPGEDFPCSPAQMFSTVCDHSNPVEGSIFAKIRPIMTLHLIKELVAEFWISNRICGLEPWGCRNCK